MNLSRFGNQLGNWSLLPVTYGDSSSVDAFGHLRVSNPKTLSANQLQYDTNLLSWFEKNTGGSATHLPNESSVRLRLTDASQSFLRQSKYLNYQAGKSQQILLTYVPISTGEGITVEVGYGDDQNGVFYQDIDGVPTITKRTYISGAAVDNTVAQEDWNIDPFDGSGPSGITLNPNAAQIFVIDLEWLGVGRVRTGFNIDGVTHYAHEFNHSNSLSSVYMATANLPIRYKISTGAGVDAANYDLIQICSTVVSEGGQDTIFGVPQSISNGATTISVTTRRPILSIRPKATFNSIVNRKYIRLEDFGGYSASEAVYLEFILGGALTGGSWADVDSTFGAAEVNVGATAISGGIRVGSVIVPAASTGAANTPGVTQRTIDNLLGLSLDIDGNHPTTPITDNLSIVATSIPGGATAVSGWINWREI